MNINGSHHNGAIALLIVEREYKHEMLFAVNLMIILLHRPKMSLIVKKRNLRRAKNVTRKRNVQASGLLDRGLLAISHVAVVQEHGKFCALRMEKQYLKHNAKKIQ